MGIHNLHNIHNSDIRELNLAEKGKKEVNLCVPMFKLTESMHCVVMQHLLRTVLTTASSCKIPPNWPVLSPQPALQLLWVELKSLWNKLMPDTDCFH